MKTRTNDEIVSFFTELFNPVVDSPWLTQGQRTHNSGFDVDIVHNKPDHVLVEVTAMYESPKLGFPEFKKVAEFFGTENVDRYNDISRGGCDTCDYGSEYGFAIRVWK